MNGGFRMEDSEWRKQTLLRSESTKFTCSPLNPAQSDPPVTDMASKEGKFSVLERLEPTGIEEENHYVPDQNEVLFSKMKWNFDGQDSFEDYVVRIGGYDFTLGVGDIWFKNTLLQSFHPPCSFIIRYETFYVYIQKEGICTGPP